MHGAYLRYTKESGYYRNLKTGEIQFLWNKCKGWKFYAKTL